jgi:hypothetical protein
MDLSPKVKAVCIAFTVAAAAPAAASSVGWSRAVTEYDFAAVSIGYIYDVPVGPWKRNVIAPVDQFNPGHGIGVGVALQGHWFRFGLDVEYVPLNNEEWERYASGVGFGIESKTKFWYGGFSAGVNPWYTRLISPYCGVRLGFLVPWGRDRSDFHWNTYHFLADGKYSFYVGGELAGHLRLANQIYVVPSLEYLSANKTTFSNRENHRVNSLIWSIKFEWRIPMSLF